MGAAAGGASSKILAGHCVSITQSIECRAGLRIRIRHFAAMGGSVPACAWLAENCGVALDRRQVR